MLEVNLVQSTRHNLSSPTLEKAYKQHLFDEYGDCVQSLVHLPIQRFGSMLISKGLFADYLQLLKGQL
jgi:hypothetical protein